MHVLKQTYDIYSGKSHLPCIGQRTQSIFKEEKKNTLSGRSIYSHSRGYIINVDLLMLAKILLCRLTALIQIHH